MESFTLDAVSTRQYEYANLTHLHTQAGMCVEPCIGPLMHYSFFHQVTSHSSPLLYHILLAIYIRFLYTYVPFSFDLFFSCLKPVKQSPKYVYSYGCGGSAANTLDCLLRRFGKRANFNITLVTKVILNRYKF